MTYSCFAQSFYESIDFLLTLNKTSLRICSKALLCETNPSTVVKPIEPFAVRLHLGKFNNVFGVAAPTSTRKHNRQNSPKCKWLHSKAPQVATSHNCIYITVHEKVKVGWVKLHKQKPNPQFQLSCLYCSSTMLMISSKRLHTFDRLIPPLYFE